MVAATLELLTQPALLVHRQESLSWSKAEQYAGTKEGRLLSGPAQVEGDVDELDEPHPADVLQNVIRLYTHAEDRTID